MAATARRFSICAASVRCCTWRVNDGQQRQHRQQNQRKPRVLHGDHREDREDSARVRRHGDHAGGEQRLHGVHVAGKARGQLAGVLRRRASRRAGASAFADISERSAWVIFWPKISSSVSCAEESTPSSARLPKYSSAAANVSGSAARQAVDDARQQQRRQQRRPAPTPPHRAACPRLSSLMRPPPRLQTAANTPLLLLHAPHLPSGFHTARDRPETDAQQRLVRAHVRLSVLHKHRLCRSSGKW